MCPRNSSSHRGSRSLGRRQILAKPSNEAAPLPHPMARTPQAKAQEMNLLYVAITRAIEELVYVS